MYPTVADVYTGSFPLPLTAHLAVGSLPSPITLAGLVEASWTNYAACTCSLFRSDSVQNGYDFIYLSMYWLNGSGVVQMPSAVYFTSIILGEFALVSLIPLPSNGQQAIVQDITNWTVQLNTLEGV